ncbi:CGNR zinc finger domain-containing protein [Streptomyces sp. NBC_00237]|uniref:CGNR zinc finger domain-containing protein n=1 Tax=Streptomyces sp. NBC_00237 TaxID=2975687 RepID=UPI00224F65CA|nr:CGNR zinc finger domain-containing protein [Streptomyces sp. NBC_00237]MCX5206587.1 CGNR zinc finger domain-containing protein [Streptomyces sp. NBC_00237]
MEPHLALELASTIRHDGNGGVADDLSDSGEEGAARWLRAQRAALLAHGLTAADLAAAEDSGTVREDLVPLREAVRALFAHAVSPAPPSPADANRLLPVPEALERLNSTAARQPVAPHLACSDGEFEQTLKPLTEHGPHVRLTAAVARAAIAFLAGPERELLRACTAPRCVRYYVQQHGRQGYCKPSCGNRARVARHYQRRHASAPDA